MRSPRVPVLLLATALSASLYAASFPPFGIHGLAFVALVPLFLVLARVGPGAGFGIGCLWSLSVGLCTSWWLPGMIAGYFGTGLAMGWLAAGAATMGTGIFYGIFAGLASLLSRGRILDPLRAAVLWGACEYARTVAFVANPWVLSGYSQAAASPVAQIADLTGVAGIGMLLAAVNAAIGGWIDPRESGRRRWVGTTAVAVALAAAAVYGELRLREPFGGGETVRVALVQSAVPRDQRFDPLARGRNLAHHVDLVARASRAAPDLVFLPELAVDVPLDGQSREGRALSRIAEESGTEILVGAPREVDLVASRAVYNSLFVLRGHDFVDRYDKVALTPFSETNPLRGWLEIGLDEYVAGSAHRPVASRAGPIAILLCGESMFGGVAREAVLRGAGLLANPANDSWFGSEAAARMQLDIAAMRAVELRRPLVRPTMTGITAVIDPHGRIVSELPSGRPGILEGTVSPATVRSLYLRFGDWLGKAAALGTLFALLVHAAARRRSGRVGAEARAASAGTMA